MNMKLSYRDKVIFIVVIVIIVLVAGFFLFIKPKFESVDVAKYNLQAKQTEWSDVESKIATYPTIVKSMKDAAKEIKEKQEIFMEEGHPYVNEKYIREKLAEVNVEVKSVTTEYTMAADIARYLVETKNILAYDNKINADLFNELPQEVYDKYNNVQREDYPTAIIGVTSMSIKFDSDIQLETAYEVIDKIAGDEKTIILNTISSSLENNSEPIQEISADLTLYCIQPLNVDKVLEEKDTIEDAVKIIEAEAAQTETTAE